MEDDELEAQMKKDQEALDDVARLVAQIMTEQAVSTVFFLELISMGWTYLRALHEQDDTVQLVRAALASAEAWMQNEPLMTAYSPEGEEVTVPMYTAEQGGLEASDQVASDLFRLVGGNFEA